jgi:hypothetical protein
VIIWVDLALLIVVSGLLSLKSIFLGSIVLITGFLMSFQVIRTRNLLGAEIQSVGIARRVKAAVLAIILSLAMVPLLEDAGPAKLFEKLFSQEAILPVVVMICLLAATAISALTVEKRKR